MRHLGINKYLMLYERHKYSYIDVYLSVSTCTYYPPAEVTSQSEDESTVTNQALIETQCLCDWPQKIDFPTASLIP